MTFAAKYHGTCNDCGGRIEPGDECVFVDDKVEHAVCGPVVVDDDTPPCTECWLIHPEGACDA